MSSGSKERIRDIGWRSPSAVGVLHLLTRQYTQLASVSVDGAHGPQQQQQLNLQGVATRLVSSPVENDPWYAVAGDQLLDPDDEAVTLPPTVTSIGANWNRSSTACSARPARTSTTTQYPGLTKSTRRRWTTGSARRR